MCNHAYFLGQVREQQYGFERMPLNVIYKRCVAHAQSMFSNGDTLSKGQVRHWIATPPPSAVKGEGAARYNAGQRKLTCEDVEWMLKLQAKEPKLGAAKLATRRMWHLCQNGEPDTHISTRSVQRMLKVVGMSFKSTRSTRKVVLGPHSAEAAQHYSMLLEELCEQLNTSSDPDKVLYADESAFATGTVPNMAWSDVCQNGRH